MKAAERSTLLRDPSLRWLMAGAFISNLGDQFTLVALPWAVLLLTGRTRCSWAWCWRWWVCRGRCSSCWVAPSSTATRLSAC
jgi:hypothetical protein